VFFRQFSRLILFDFSILREVGLCAYEYFADWLAGIAFDLLDPAADVLEGLFVIDAIGQDYATGALVVGLRDVAETLLAGRVPDLQADLGVIDTDGLDLEVHSNSGYITVLEDAVAELGEQVCLADPTVTDYDHFCQEVFFWLFRCHSSINIIQVKRMLREVLKIVFDWASDKTYRT